jgi:hypothetical protein
MITNLLRDTRSPCANLTLKKYSERLEGVKGYQGLRAYIDGISMMVNDKQLSVVCRTHDNMGGACQRDRYTQLARNQKKERAQEQSDEQETERSRKMR